MKTAEEILDKAMLDYYTPSFPSIKRTKEVMAVIHTSEDRKPCLNAMQEYSNQQLAEYKEKLKEKLDTLQWPGSVLNVHSIKTLIDNL
jgi:hypothetical protein